MASPPALPVLTARLGWIAEVAASTEHHPPRDSRDWGTGPRCNYTNPAELALFPGNLDQITYGIRAAPLGADLVVVGVQCIITHGAVGEFFVPAE